MKFIERDGAAVRPEYINSFQAYAGNGEVVLELSRVDLAATLKGSDGEAEPDVVVDIKGRFVLRPESISQLINTLVSAISTPAQPAASKEKKA